MRIFLEVFEQVASYLLELDHLKLDLESMFLDKENRPVLCYLPEYEKKIDEQLRDFIEECIEYISGDDKKRVRFYYEFHSFLIKENQYGAERRLSGSSVRENE